MSTNESQNSSLSHAADEAASPWSGESRETWVSMAISAATASLRGTEPATGEIAEVQSGADPA